MQPTPEQLGIWVLCAIVALDLFFRFSEFLDRKQEAKERERNGEKPQKREVSFEQECASKDEFEKHQQASINSRREMHKDINALKEVVAGLKENSGNNGIRLQQLDTKFDNLLRALAEAGLLKKNQ